MLGIFNCERVFLITLKVLKGVLQMKSPSLIKSPPVMNDIDNILGKKRLLLAEGAGHRYRGAAAAGFLARAC